MSVRAPEEIRARAANSNRPIAAAMTTAASASWGGDDDDYADDRADKDSGLQARGIELNFAEMKDSVKDKLKRFGLFEALGDRRFFPMIDSAVRGGRRCQAGLQAFPDGLFLRRASGFVPAFQPLTGFEDERR